MRSRSGWSSRDVRSRSRTTSRASASAPSSPALLSRRPRTSSARCAARSASGPSPSSVQSSTTASPISGGAPASTRSSSCSAASGSASAARGSPQTSAEAAPGSRTSKPFSSALRASASPASGDTAVIAATDAAARRHSVGESDGASASSMARANAGIDGARSPARHGHVPPHERLPIGQEPLPSLRHGVDLEDAQAVVVPERRALGGLARRPLQEPRGEPARGQRPGRRPRDPVPSQVAPRGERQRERPVVHPERDRQLGHEPHAGAHARAREPLAGAERHLPRDRDERRRVGGDQARQHAPPELPLLGAHRQRRRHLVERRPRRGRPEPVEVVHEPPLERRAHAREQSLGVQALERAGALLVDDARERSHRLTPTRTAGRRIRQLVELEQAARVEGRVAQG